MADDVTRAYGVLANTYIELFGSTTQVHPNDLALIAKHLSIQPGTVLDVGCGPGHHTARLRSLGVDSLGIDLVPEFIDHACAAYPGGRFEVASLFELPVPEYCAKAILAWYSLIHLHPDDMNRALSEFRRALAPGGTLVVGFFEGDRIETFNHKVATAYYWPIDQLSLRLAQAGFVEVEREQRPGAAETGIRAHGAIVVRASDPHLPNAMHSE